MTTFKRGDKTIFQGEQVEVLHGPERGNTGDRYMIRDQNGRVVVSGELEPLPTVDPRREVVAKAIHGRQWVGTWGDATPGTVSECYADADAVLAALDAHAEQEGDAPGTRYQDYDDDVWEVQTDRRPMLVQYADGGHVTPGCYKDSVGELSDVHGPLIRL